jgi:hypothetical protein
MAKKAWKGVIQNSCHFQGRVVGDPQVIPTQNGEEFIFLTLESEVLNRAANGQISPADVLVPLMVEPGSTNNKVVKQYVSDGREIFVETEYKAWEGQNGPEHRFAIIRLKLGNRPYKPQEDSNAGVPPLPNR